MSSFLPLVLSAGIPRQLPSGDFLEIRAPRCRVVRSSNQTLVPNAETNVSFSSAQINIGGDWWNPAQPDRITAPFSGDYLIGASVRVTVPSGEVAVILKTQYGYLAPNRVPRMSVNDFTPVIMATLTAGTAIFLSAYAISGSFSYVSGFSPVLWAVKL